MIPTVSPRRCSTALIGCYTRVRLGHIRVSFSNPATLSL